MPEWTITRVNDMGATEGLIFTHVIYFRPFYFNFPLLPEPADDSDEEDFILDLDDNKSSFRDCLSSASDQRRDNSTLDDGALDISNVNSDDNVATNTASDAMATNNDSTTNVYLIDQRRDITNEDDGSSIFNDPTITSPDNASDSGSILNDEPENETNADEDACDIDNWRDHEDDDNISA